MKNLQPIYQVTYLIEPPKLGMLVIEQQVLNEQQYSILKETITTPTHIASINYGETNHKGVVFTGYTSNTSCLNDIIDAILALSVDIVNMGISDYEYAHTMKPREDLRLCLDNSKCYIIGNISEPSCLSKYFNVDEIIKVSSNNITGRLGRIVLANKDTLADLDS